MDQKTARGDQIHVGAVLICVVKNPARHSRMGYLMKYGTPIGDIENRSLETTGFSFG